LAGAALVTAVVAILRARALGKRLERLSESYWELRYENGQLRSHLTRLEGQSDPPAGTVPSPAVFVPLSSLRK
jgi:hypothetical protein